MSKKADDLTKEAGKKDGGRPTAKEKKKNTTKRNTPSASEQNEKIYEARIGVPGCSFCRVRYHPDR